MAGSLVHDLAREVRRADADVAGSELGFLRELFKFLDDHGAFRQPERQAGADVFGVHHVQAHLRADFAVVALLRFFEHGEILVHLGLVLERRPVNALELRVLLVALVIRAGDAGHLERADVTGAHHVRSSAKINEFSGLEIRNRFIRRNAFDDIEFEFARNFPVAERGEPTSFRIGQRLIASDDDLLENLVRFNNLLHLSFDGREVFR